VGDFNIHVDDVMDISAGKLADILDSHSLVQHVRSPTHSHGHTLDLFITRDDQVIELLPVDLPLLSDHSFVVADCDCSAVPAVSPSFRRVRNWRQLDVEEFTADLVQTELIVSPPDDVVSAYECYESTLRALLDKHVPLQSKRVRTRASARWYDSECREVKRTTRRLERRYRRLRTPDSMTAWSQQFCVQRQLYQTKFESFWSQTVDACKNSSRDLWRAVNDMLQPPSSSGPQQQPDTSQKLCADDFASFFRDKVAAIRASTASAASPTIIAQRQAPSLSTFEPVTVDEVTKLLNKMPAKSYSHMAVETSDILHRTNHLPSLQFVHCDR